MEELYSNFNSESAIRRGDRIKLNVGGKVFETTVSTIRAGGPDSLLATLSARALDEQNPVFIDRDPEIFSVLLSLLRSNHLPSTASRFSKQELSDEALYYGIESSLRSAMLPPPLSGIDASLISTIQPTADGIPTVFTAAAGDGSIWVAHGGQISDYDWNLTHAGTLRTHLEEISSICRVWPELAAIGSDTLPGLHFYDFSGGRHVGTCNWRDASDPRIYKACVSAIASSPDSVFASFECPHKENCVLVIDKSTLQISSELGRQRGNAAKNMVAKKLAFLQQSGIVFGSSVSAGAFGYAGYMRLWDPRSGEVVWETNEPGSGRTSRFGDSFADVDVDVEESMMFKICSKSGDLAVADLRNLGDDPWVYLRDKNPSLRNTGGGQESVLHCYRKQVFVSRGGELEVWSPVREKEEREPDDEREVSVCEESYRRNFVDKEEDSKRGTIKRMEGGGDRLFVSREGVEGIEVWGSSNLSGAVSVL